MSVSLYIRCTDSKTKNNKGKFILLSQESYKPHKAFAKYQGLCDKKWNKIYSHGTADRNFNPGEAKFTINMGHHAQEIEIGNIKIVNLGKGIDIRKLPYNKLSYEGRDKNAEWRKKAQKRIEKIRKGDLTVKVMDNNRTPLKDVEIKIEMKRHLYGFGAYANSGIARKGRDGDKYRGWFKKLFNWATAPYYWTNKHDTWGWKIPAYRKQFLEISQWLKQNDFRIRAHNMLWGAWQWVPKEARIHKNNPVKLKQVIDERIKTITTAAKQFDVIQWDVINEPYTCHDLIDTLGKKEIIEWFKLVRHLDPNPGLFLNEYNILTYWGTHYKQQDNYENIIKYLIDSNAPLGGIGMQSHFNQDLTEIETILDILDRFAKFNKDIVITEFDVNILDEETQADYTRDFYTAIFSHPATKGIIMWGFWEGCHRKPNCVFFRKDWSQKPNLNAYMDIVFNKWWTRANGRTDKNGEFEARGFMGDYEIKVLKDGIQKSVKTKIEKQDNTIEIILK